VKTDFFAAKTAPAIVVETSSFIVVYKPPRLHSAPLGPSGENKNGDGASGSAGNGRTGGTSTAETLLDFVAAIYPEVRLVRGWKPVEGGLVHRLDYDTRGLLLAARSQAAMNALRGQQEQDRIVKEYTAVSALAAETLPGFPPAPLPPGKSGAVESAFRPYGKGRKAVRPVLPSPALKTYRTEILSPEKSAGGNERIRVRISRGYRHQIRCHLAWIGRPIVNDPLYGGVNDGAVSEGCLALCAEAISFTDPETGRRLRYSLEEF
jgi:23S rRNA pseudouridine1911/1915/1917 synthase